MDLRAKIGQLIVVRASGYLSDRQRRYPQWEADNQTLESWLRDLNLGGVILLGASATEIKTRTKLLQSWAKTPLLVAADIEAGVGQRFSGKTWFPPPMALAAIAQKDLTQAQKYAYQMGAVTAQEALAIGINWLLAPVVDVNNNPDNPVINIRAFGESPEIVSALTKAFIAGAQTTQIVTTAKHFPGHGDTATDSHLDLPIIQHDRDRLEKVELPPFQSAIETGVDSIMTAHLTVPTWDKHKPATLSRSILTGVLREQLGFSGLIVTDALIMGGITKYSDPETVAVMAIDAGVDILLMPENPKTAIEAIYQAVTQGKISEDRIEESYQRVQTLKNKVNPDQISQTIPSNIPTKTKKSHNSASLVLDGYRVAEQIVKDSLAVTGNLPLEVSNPQECRNLIVVDDVLSANYLDLATPAIAVPQSLGYQRQIIDSHSLSLINQDSRPTLLQLFIRGNPFRGSAGLTPEAQQQYQQLLDSDRLIGLVIYGSPYVRAWFESQIAPEIPFIFSYGQMDIAQGVALKNLFTSVEDPRKRPDNFGF